MRIGVTYDLKSDYLALGHSEEDVAEFDSEITIDAICDALTAQGWQVSRIGHVKNLVEKVARGERWDAASLEAYDIPYVFSDPLTLAVTIDKAMAKRVARDQGVPTPDFAVIEKIADVGKVKLPYPLFLKPVAAGSG